MTVIAGLALRLRKRCGSLWGIMTEQKSFPVRYMVVPMQFVGRTDCCKILDTLEGGTVCRFVKPVWAHLIAQLLNEAEGYRYGDT